MSSKESKNLNSEFPYHSHNYTGPFKRWSIPIEVLTADKKGTSTIKKTIVTIIDTNRPKS